MTVPPDSAGWSIQNIISKARAVTGTPSTDQLSDQQMLAYANNYLTFTMPFELKNQVQNQFLQFKTTPGQNVYAFPGTYLTDSPGAYADGFPLIFYEDPDIFFQDWPQQYAVDQVGTGNGINPTFASTTQAFPIIPGSFFITDSIQVLQDNGTGTLTGDGTGTINYLSGAYTATFTNPPAAQLVIYAKYIAYQGNRPQGVLFFNNQFTFMPVPDQVYQILMQGFINPNQLSLLPLGQTPVFPEWGPCIAYGMAVEIFNDRGDDANSKIAYGNLKRYENIALARTIQQYTPMQGVGRF
jgi:hypothetical protein